LNRDIFAEIYRTKLGHPWRRGRAWPMRKLEAGAGHYRERIQSIEGQEKMDKIKPKRWTGSRERSNLTEFQERKKY
jgi:hypothetical protein